MPRKVGTFSRLVAAILAIVWAGAAVASLVAAFLYRQWLLGLAGVFALWYAIVWLRVASRGRLLTWREAATPWRAR